jgi:predicted kinase
MLIAFSGLPGTGKTTISRQLAARLAAVYIRVDTIEQAIRNAGVLAQDVGTAGYNVAIALAETNLGLGLVVIVDSVNPVAESRAAFRAIAKKNGKRLTDVEIICSDKAEHRRRVETRTTDIPGHMLPSWDAVQTHDYEPWLTPRLLIDTSATEPGDAVAIIEQHVKQT